VAGDSSIITAAFSVDWLKCINVAPKPSKPPTPAAHALKASVCISNRGSALARYAGLPGAMAEEIVAVLNHRKRI
jgi:hypothetical protein